MLLRAKGRVPLREAIPEEATHILKGGYDQDRLTILFPPWRKRPPETVEHAPGVDVYQYTDSLERSSIVDVALPPDSVLLVCRRRARGHRLKRGDFLYGVARNEFFGCYFGGLIRTTDEQLRIWCDEPHEELPPFVSFSINHAREPASSFKILADRFRWKSEAWAKRPGELKALLESIWAKHDEEASDPGSARAFQGLRQEYLVTGPQLYGITGALIYER